MVRHYGTVYLRAGRDGRRSGNSGFFIGACTLSKHHHHCTQLATQQEESGHICFPTLTQGPQCRCVCAQEPGTLTLYGGRDDRAVTSFKTGPHQFSNISNIALVRVENLLFIMKIKFYMPKNTTVNHGVWFGFVFDIEAKL